VKGKQELLFLKKKKQKNFWSASRGSQRLAVQPRAQRTHHALPVMAGLDPAIHA